MISKEIENKLKQCGESFILEFKFANEKYIQVLKLSNEKIQYIYYKVNNNEIALVTNKKLLNEFIEKYEILPDNIEDESKNNNQENYLSDKRIKNEEIKQWTSKFTVDKLSSCNSFVRVYGKRYANRKIRKLKNVYTNEEDYLHSGYQSGDEITICIKGKNGNLYSVDEIEKNEKIQQIALHEAIHLIFRHGEFTTGMKILVECKGKSKKYTEIGRGLNEGLTEWITKKCGYDVSMGGYKVLTKFIEQLEIALGEDAIMALGKGKDIHKILNMSKQEAYAFLSKVDRYYKNIEQITDLDYIIRTLKRYKNIERLDEETKEKVEKDYEELISTNLYRKTGVEYEEYLLVEGLENSVENLIQFCTQKRNELEQTQTNIRTDIEDEIFLKYFSKEFEEVLSMEVIPDDKMEKYQELYSLMLHEEGEDRTSKLLEMKKKYTLQISKEMQEKYNDNSLTVHDFMNYLQRGGDITISHELEKIIFGKHNEDIFFLVSNLKDRGELEEIGQYSLKKINGEHGEEVIYFKGNKPSFESIAPAIEVTNKNAKDYENIFDITLKTNEEFSNIIKDFEALREKTLSENLNAKFYILNRAIVVTDGEKESFYIISNGVEPAELKGEYAFNFVQEERKIDKVIDNQNLPAPHKPNIFSKIASLFRNFKRNDVDIEEEDDNIKNNTISVKEKRNAMISEIKAKTPTIKDRNNDSLNNSRNDERDI